MSTEIYLPTDPIEANFVRAVVTAVVRDVRKHKIDLDGEVVAKRVIYHFEQGERDYSRLRALVLGAEAARQRFAN